MLQYSVVDCLSTIKYHFILFPIDFEAVQTFAKIRNFPKMFRK